jgi:predicted  nucleic acid-binding Zn-ribbon protein
LSEDKTKETNETRSFEERVLMRFDSIDARFNSMDARFDSMDARFDSMDARFDDVASRLDKVEHRLDGVESGLESVNARVEKLEMKQYDSRPAWEQAMAAIAETNTRLDQGFEQLRTEMKAEFATLRSEIDHSLHGVERKIDALNHNILQVQADQRYNDRRLEELEGHIKPT